MTFRSRVSSCNVSDVAERIRRTQGGLPRTVWSRQRTPKFCERFLVCHRHFQQIPSCLWREVWGLTCYFLLQGHIKCERRFRGKKEKYFISLLQPRFPLYPSKMGKNCWWLWWNSETLKFHASHQFRRQALRWCITQNRNAVLVECKI